MSVELQIASDCSELPEQQSLIDWVKLEEQGKQAAAHWAHMVIHGCLHLQGYDHINDDDAQVMELLEIKLLNSIGIKNPYEG